MTGGAQRGFSLVETSLAVAIIGVLVAAAAGGYVNVDQVTDRQQAERHGERVRTAVRAFARSHGRLPCPDPMGGGDGWEGDCDADRDLETGRVPYRSLGLAMPEPGLRAFYAVYRDAGAGADLARARDRSGNGRVDNNDLVRGLRNAIDAGRPAARVHVVGETGGGDCDNPERPRSVAYMLVMPLGDRDGDGSRFDGPHPGSCALVHRQGPQHDNDDVVLTGAFMTLAARLTRDGTRP